MDLSFRPSSKRGWWAFCLGLLAAGWAFLFPFISNWLTALLYAPNRDLGPLMRPFGSGGVLVAWLLAAAAIVTSVVTLWKGERSWQVFAGLALAVLAGGFWLLFALGEMLMAY